MHDLGHNKIGANHIRLCQRVVKVEVLFNSAFGLAIEANSEQLIVLIQLCWIPGRLDHWLVLEALFKPSRTLLENFLDCLPLRDGVEDDKPLNSGPRNSLERRYHLLYLVQTPDKNIDALSML